ncbi:hypothetical protein CSE16_11215 [Solibacillus sp. R5-41]|uniref:DUF2812 domain-containing protein n=1 Tax=Solibacillus sp. R5-41 TaxID=2048654 RepID=UPI000C1295CD|nr:DUF2812 domain-containing protein [Solibacillus sp. R5-41]ATP40574.1 hypothetical protein CSE16_11215 [Solibacillus sp. R5-41]
MTKIVRKVRPTDYWRIGEHESWFADMSAKGLHLYKMGTHFAHFKKGVPKRMEYRIEVTQTKEMSYEQSNMYEENGWGYVESYQFFHVFSSLAENHAPELHTDPMEQSYTLDQLNKRLILNFIQISLVFLFIICTLAAMWFLDGTPILQLVEGQLTQLITSSLTFLYIVYYSTRAMIAIQVLRRNLIEGKAINHHAPWEKRLRRNTVFSILFATIILISATLPIVQIWKWETFTLPENGSNLPLVRLADIEQKPLLVGDDNYIDGINLADQYTSNWSVFAPVQYEFYESGVIKGGKWLGERGPYSPGVFTEVYQLTLKILAEPLISDLIKWHSLENKTDLFVEKQHSNFDRLIIYENKGLKQLIASKGKVVMYVRYSGNAGIDVLIENAAQKIRLLAGK